MNITGKTMIFKSEYGYSTAISKKNESGEYERMYVQIQFPKGVELENKTMIEITKGFLSFYKTKEGLSKLKLVVMDYTTEAEAEEQYNKEEREAIQNEQNYEYKSNDLPF
jgi:hypothetical protein